MNNFFDLSCVFISILRALRSLSAEKSFGSLFLCLLVKSQKRPDPHHRPKRGSLKHIGALGDTEMKDVENASRLHLEPLKYALLPLTTCNPRSLCPPAEDKQRTASQDASNNEGNARL